MMATTGNGEAGSELFMGLERKETVIERLQTSVQDFNQESIVIEGGLQNTMDVLNGFDENFSEQLNFNR